MSQRIKSNLVIDLLIKNIIFTFLLINLSITISYSQQVFHSTYAREYSESLIHGNVKSILTSEYSIKKKRKKIKKGKIDAFIKKYHFKDNKLSKIESFKPEKRKLILKNCLYYENGIFYKHETFLEDSVQIRGNSLLIYNKFGKIEKITCHGEAPCSIEREFTYEDETKLVYEERLRYGVATLHIFYSYNDNELIKKSYCKYEDKEPYAYRGFSYNKEGLLHKDSSINMEENRSTFATYEYDEYSNISLQKMTGDINVELEFKYEYDSQNNWTKLIVYRDEMPIKYFERIIEYNTTDNKVQNGNSR